MWSKRLLGFALVTRALTPLIVLMLVILAGLRMLDAAQKHLTPPLQQMGRTAEDLRKDTQAVGVELQAISSRLTQAGQALTANLPNLDALSLNLPDHFTVPAINIPDPSIPAPTASVNFSEINAGFIGKIRYPSNISIGSTAHPLTIPDIPPMNIDLPGLKNIDTELKGAMEPFFSTIKGVKSEFTQISDGVTKLKGQVENASTSAKRVAGDGELLLEGLQKLLVDIALIVGVAVVILFLLALNYFILPLIEDFRKGIHLLFGKKEPTA